MTTTTFASGASYGIATGVHGTVYATARSTSTTYGTSLLYVGQRLLSTQFYIYRGCIKFDTSAIGAGSTVTQVNLRMAVQGNGSTTDFDMQIVKYDWSAQDPITNTNREAVFDGCLAATLDDSIWLNTAGISTNTQYTSGNLSTAWVNKTGTTYYGLRSKEDTDASQQTANEYLDIHPPNAATADYRPALIVTYETAAGCPVQSMYYMKQRGK